MDPIYGILISGFIALVGVAGTVVANRRSVAVVELQTALSEQRIIIDRQAATIKELEARIEHLEGIS